MKSLRQLLMLSAVLGLVGTGTGAAFAAEPAKAKDTPKDLILKGDAKCTGCHDEADDTKPTMLDLKPSVLAIGKTKHGTRADGRTPTCTDCHGESEKHVNHKGSDKPLDLIEKALRIDPEHVLGLWLAGSAAYNRNDYAGAAGYWERAIKVLPPDSEDARMLGESAAEAKRRATLKIDPAQTVAGKVELSPKLATQAAPDDTVFIFARPADGTRVPLAVARVRVADLPYAFVLDDSMAMTPERSISGESRVIVEARVSRTGNAIAKDGDLQSEALTTRVGERSLRLKIDRIVRRPAPGA